MITGQNYINGTWQDAHGQEFTVMDQGQQIPLWRGKQSTAADVDQAVQAASNAWLSWANLDFASRAEILIRYADILGQEKEAWTLALARETGKPKWECFTEISAMIGKVNISIQAMKSRTWPQNFKEDSAWLRFKPHGVIGVIGPFNMPGHLPNGHIVPALLAGNTIIFKPAELTPYSGQWLVESLEKAGLPSGVVNLVQGGKDTGVYLTSHDDLDGIFFTGSYATGRAIHQANSHRPERILALEMGGNNPLIVWQAENMEAAAYLTVESAYISSGQRCTCARRLIVPADSYGDEFLKTLIKMVKRIKSGSYTDEPEPFMGPVISKQAADLVLDTQLHWQKLGARVLVQSKRLSPDNLVSPGLIDTTGVSGFDEEIFGPLLQVIRVQDFDHALQVANDTKYGLAAALLSDHKELYKKFYNSIRAGVVNWNRRTTGASSKLPFGGVGASGNHRPSALFAADYCSFPVSSLEIDQLQMPKAILPGISL